MTLYKYLIPDMDYDELKINMKKFKDLQHPCLLRYTNLIEDEKNLYILMEYFEGDILKE